MSYWEEFKAWLRVLFRPSRPPAEPGAGPEPPAAMHPRVLLITYDPTIQSEGGRRLSEVMRWNDVDELCRGYIADLKECSGGFVNYEIVQRLEVDAWPLKEDGFRYDGETYVKNWRSGKGWHRPDTLSYEAVLAEFDLPARVEADQIDEVWLFGFPYAGFYESRMVGPGAFWCNAPALPNRDVSRRFVIMGFNYERKVGPMLESFGHRVESILKHTWRGVKGDDNLYERFVLYDQIAPGRANCGWMHYAPNSLKDYDWGNKTYVDSNCDDWLSFPDLEGTVRRVNCRDWGDGDMRAHHKWWFDRLPKAAGHSHGIANNWWWYAIDPNAVQ